MRVVIKQKLRPFSHTPGRVCLIPFTTWELQAFPALLVFRNLETQEEKVMETPIKGPLKEFTLIQDLERGRIEIIRRGYPTHIIAGDSYPFLRPVALPENKARMSFGIHKAQDWDLVKRRCLMTEVFPFLFRLSHLIPHVALPKEPVGTMALLDSIEEGTFFQAAFQGILSPRLNDEQHLGVIPPSQAEGCPIGLIHAAAEQILRLIFAEDGSEWKLLPQLPSTFHAGRLTALTTNSGHQFDLEWSKKKIKKLIIRPQSTETIHLRLSKGIKTFRMRMNLRQKGQVHPVNTPISLKVGQVLYFDRFS